MSIAFAGDAEAAAADTNFPYAPAGEGYYLKVRNAKEQISKKSGRPMIATEYVIAEGEYEGIHVFNYLTFIEAGAKGHGMTIHGLKAHGLPWEGDVEISAADFENVMVKVDLGVEEYPVGSKQMKNVIKKFHLPPEGEAQEPIGGRMMDEPPVDEPVSPKEASIVEAAKKAGLVKPAATARVVAKPAAVKKALPWKRR